MSEQIEIINVSQSLIVALLLSVGDVISVYFTDTEKGETYTMTDFNEDVISLAPTEYPTLRYKLHVCDVEKAVIHQSGISGASFLILWTDSGYIKNKI